MAFFNYVTKEITLKVVYYGPGLSGKTTNLQHLYSVLDPSSRGKFISLATEADRTLFFDFLPVDLGKINDFTLKFQLYTVPGQIRYNATRKLVLKGADAVVFVVDSQREMKEQNIESFLNMRENLTSNNIDPDGIPIVLQYNKRDLPDILSPEELNEYLDGGNYRTLEAEAINGRGVRETFQVVTKLLLQDIVRKHRVDISPPAERGREAVLEEAAAPEGVGAPPETEEIVEAVVDFPSTAPEKPLSSTERMDEIAAGLKEVAESLQRMGDAFDGKVSELAESLARTREALSHLGAEIDESRRRQNDIAHELKEIHMLLATIRAKKGWFRFSR